MAIDARSNGRTFHFYHKRQRTGAARQPPVPRTVHGLVDYLRVERKRVPGEVLFEADRLECLLFAGYDPHFEGDEPPGL
jgi:hypothetical protein